MQSIFTAGNNGLYAIEGIYQPSIYVTKTENEHRKSRPMRIPAPPTYFSMNVAEKDHILKLSNEHEELLVEKHTRRLHSEEYLMMATGAWA